MVLNRGTFNCMRPQHLRCCCHASYCAAQTYPQLLTGVSFLADMHLDWSSSISFHTGYETTLQCCWFLVILDLVKLRKKINSFSYFEVYRSGLFYRRSQGTYCGEKLLQRKEEKVNMSRNTEAFCQATLLCSPVQQLYRKKSFHLKNCHQIKNEN